MTLIKELGRLVRMGKLSRVRCAHGCLCEMKGSMVGTGSN